MVTKAKAPAIQLQMTVEQEIEKIRKESEEKIKELQKKLVWEQRFKLVFDKYVKENHETFAKHVTGHKVDTDFIYDMNEYLESYDFKVEYNSASFDNDFHNSTYNDNIVAICDLSDYPTYVVLAVKDLSNYQSGGYIRINCNYSSYNNTEFSHWHFVRMLQVTCQTFKNYSI
jgi:hypothetical protein